MDEKKVKQLEDYLSSLKGGAIIQYSFEGDDKVSTLFVVEIKNGKVHGQLQGPYGARVEPLKDIAEKGFKIAEFKGLEEVLKKKSKK